MYNSITAADIKASPLLDDLDLERLPQELTEVYARIVSARIAIPQIEDKTTLNKELDKISRLGYTYFALVNFAPSEEIQRSAAFVAGSAFGLLAAVKGPVADGRFTASSICQTCSAALLFMIADASSDAAEIVRHLPSEDDDESLEGRLRFAIKSLAQGDIMRVAEMPIVEHGNELEDMTERAVATLYSRCLNGIAELCRSLMGHGDIETAVTMFEQTKALCTEECSDLMDEFMPGGLCPSVFSGPFLLSSLLASTAPRLFLHALINITNPNISNVVSWKEEIVRLARIRPYLWPNHKRIIDNTQCLDHGVSTVLGIPTGAGKTTLAQLKACASLVDGQKILFLAPTHALVTQVTNEWRESFPEASVKNSFLSDGEYAETENEELPDITVMTPERCLTLVMMNPQSFTDVGLVIMDECHILHATSIDDSYRATDAMFCLLRLFNASPNADFMLMSAMIENTDELAGWIEQQTNRRCAPVQDEWKPTRQVRSCVIYARGETQQLHTKLSRDKREVKRKGKKNPSSAIKKELKVHPYGFFCLNQTWNTKQLSDYCVLPLSDETVLLGTNKYWGLAPNRNVVSAKLAVKLVKANVKTIVFSQQIGYTTAIAGQVAKEVGNQNNVDFNDQELELWSQLIEELGGANYIFGPVGGVAACHHGLLLEKERKLVESMFARDSGVKVLVATPTLAQGMNLPAEAVIIAGDDRFDSAQDEQAELEAHELLNAAGRAGRAGHKAQGFVLIVTGKIVEFNDEDNSLSSSWFDLQKRVFSKSDQCLTIVDPLQRLIDTIHSGTTENVLSVNYIFRRIPCDPAQTPDENVRRTMSRSFAAFMAQRNNGLDTFEKGVAEVAELGKSIIRPDKLTGHPWSETLATELGISPELILQIDEHLDAIKSDWVVNDYIRWLFENQIIEKVAKPQTFEDVVKNLTTPKERRELENFKEKSLNLFECLLKKWVYGRTFSEIEMRAGTDQKKLGKCLIARKLALRWVPDVSYACGVVTRLYRRHCDSEDNIQMPTVLATLAACLRQGVDSPAKLAILQLNHYEITRVRANRIFENIAERLGVSDSFESFGLTKNKVRIAMTEVGYL